MKESWKNFWKDYRHWVWEATGIPFLKRHPVYAAINWIIPFGFIGWVIYEHHKDDIKAKFKKKHKYPWIYHED